MKNILVKTLSYRRKIEKIRQKEMLTQNQLLDMIDLSYRCIFGTITTTFRFKTLQLMLDFITLYEQDYEKWKTLKCK